MKRVAGEDAHTQARVLFAVQGAWFAATEGKEKGASGVVSQTRLPACPLVNRCAWCR